MKKANAPRLRGRQLVLQGKPYQQKWSFWRGISRGIYIRDVWKVA